MGSDGDIAIMWLQLTTIEGMTMDKTDAGAAYILAALLPRLEEIRPGLLGDLVSGLAADREAITDDGKMTPELDAVFLSAECILGRPLQ